MKSTKEILVYEVPEGRVHQYSLLVPRRTAGLPIPEGQYVESGRNGEFILVCRLQESPRRYWAKEADIAPFGERYQPASGE